MKIDPQSAFRAELVTSTSKMPFDSPRCAIDTYGQLGGALHVQEFYARAYESADEVSFVEGSDILGPMGPDFIPVSLSKVEKFIHDHGGRARTFAELTAQAPSR